MPARPLLLAAFLAATPIVAHAADPAPQLKVSDNKHFLVTADDKPFFWLADTAWELFHRGTREEAEKYLDTRAKQGFNVVHRAERLRPPAADAARPGPPGDQARPGRRLLGPRRFRRQGSQRARHRRRAVADLGPALARQGVDFHAGQRRRLRRVARGTLQGRGRRLGTRRGPAGRDGGAEGGHPGDGRGAEEGGRRQAPADLPPARRPRLRGVVPDRLLARLQHAAERPRHRVHRPLRQDPRRLRPQADQARHRRRAGVRGAPGRVQRQAVRPHDGRGRAAGLLLGHVRRGVRPHLRAPQPTPSTTPARRKWRSASG
jgi:hypothetical protein